MHVLLVLDAGCRLNRRGDQVVSVTGVARLRAGWSDQRVILEQREHVVHVVEMPGVQRGIPLLPPMTYTGEVSRQQPRRDDSARLYRKCGNGTVDRRVENDSARFVAV